MINRDWERFGEDIRKTVQDAIDSQDFGKLNQTITNTINKAVDHVSRSIRGAQGEYESWQQNRAEGGSPGHGDSHSHGYVHGGSGRHGYAHGGSHSHAHAYGDSHSHGYAHGGSGRQGRAHGDFYRQEQARDRQAAASGSRMQAAPRKQVPVLYRRATPIQVKGTLAAVFGAVTGGTCLAGFLSSFLPLLISGIYGTAQIMVTALLLILTVAGFSVFVRGTGIRERARRFRTYIQVLGQREYCNVRELADKVQRDVKYVVKDLEYMFSHGWFLQGHLDDEKACLIASHDMYQQYRQLREERKRSGMAMAQEQKDVWQEETGQRKQDGERQDGKSQESVQARRSKLPTEVQRVMDEGDAYIRKIHACNDAIPSEEISAKISRMELLIDRIFGRVEQIPESVDDIRRLMEYYLPTTVKLLEAYQELDAQPVDGENIRSSKREIEATLDTLNVAFEKLLDSLFQETAWDVSSDISVLHTMLAQEGLTDDGLRSSPQS